MNWTTFFFGYAIGVATVLVWAWIGILWDERKRNKGRHRNMCETVTTSDPNLTIEEAESIVAFIENHKRNEIPDDVWDLCMRLEEELEHWVWKMN